MAIQFQDTSNAAMPERFGHLVGTNEVIARKLLKIKIDIWCREGEARTPTRLPPADFEAPDPSFSQYAVLAAHVEAPKSNRHAATGIQIRDLARRN
jgi:hypothetical protein